MELAIELEHRDYGQPASVSRLLSTAMHTSGANYPPGRPGVYCKHWSKIDSFLTMAISFPCRNCVHLLNGEPSRPGGLTPIIDQAYQSSSTRSNAAINYRPVCELCPLTQVWNGMWLSCYIEIKVQTLIIIVSKKSLQ